MTRGACKFPILQNEACDAVNLALAQVSHAAGAQVVMNAAPARELLRDPPELIDVNIILRVEAEAMGGAHVTSRATAHAALVKLASNSPLVIVTLGGDGVVVATASVDVLDSEPISVRVTSTHGAGDCIFGALCAQPATGASLLDACRVANQTTAAVVSKPH